MTAHSSKGRPSNTAPSNATPPRILAAGVDSHYVGLVGEVNPRFLNRALALREQTLGTPGRPGTSSAPARPAIKVAGRAFRFLPSGGRGYTFGLEADDRTIMVKTLADGRARLRVELRSALLWELGSALALEDTIDVVVPSILLTVEDRYAQRIDLCVDVAGWTPSSDELLDHVTRATNVAHFHDRGNFTGIRAGTGPLAVRIYDKLTEIQLSGKSWFHRVWRTDSSDPGLTVWRVEAQIGREAVRQFELPSVPSPEELEGAWRYVTTRWFRLIDSRTATRRHRAQPTDPWAVVIDAGFGPTTEPTLRRRATEARLERLVPSFVGSLAAIGSARGATSLDGAFDEARKLAAEDLGRRGRRFVDLLDAKRAQWPATRSAERSPASSDRQ